MLGFKLCDHKAARKGALCHHLQHLINACEKGLTDCSTDNGLTDCSMDDCTNNSSANTSTKISLTDCSTNLRTNISFT